MKEVMLGKISSVKFGLCGYQECQLGLQLGFTSSSFGVSFTKAFWDSNRMKITKRTEWTEQDRQDGYADIMTYLSGILKDGGKENVSDLVGVPVELTFKDALLKDWRVLKEVL